MGWRASRPALGVAVAAVVAVLLTACSSGPDPAGNDAEPVIEATPTVAVQTLALPLDAYRMSAQEEATVQQAVGLLTRDCMKRFGFDYPVASPAAGSTQGIGRRYFLVDAESAAKNGYHPAPQQQQTNGVTGDKPALSPAAQGVVSGKGQSKVNGQTVPEGGCNAEASRRLATGVTSSPDQQLVGDLSDDSYNRSMRHSRVVAAFAAWSTCMSKAGYNYRTPQDANNDRTFSTDLPSAQEIATATADVRCKEETNLTAIWASAEIAYQRREIEVNKLRLDNVKAAQKVILKNAASAVAAG